MKTLKKVSFLIITVVTFVSSEFLWGGIQIDGEREVSFEKLEHIAHDVTELLGDSSNHSIESLYIGGATVGAILDMLINDKPLKIRDLDFYFVTDQQYQPSDWKQLVQGRKHIKNLRVLPDMVQLKIHEMPVDITYVGGKKKLRSIGIFNVDVMKIDINAFFKAFSKGDEKSTLANTSHWLFENEKLEYWMNRHIILNPYHDKHRWEILAFRASRTFAKFGFNQLSPEVLQHIRQLSSQKTDKKFRKKDWLKGLVKVLGDPTAGVQLKILLEAGALVFFSDMFQDNVNQISIKKLNDLILDARTIGGGPISVLSQLIHKIGNKNDLKLLEEVSQYIDPKYHKFIFNKFEDQLPKVQCSILLQ